MSDNANTTPYRVLARKYRPENFDELRGQDALVRTLKNAITSGRLAQAYMLTGVRGVGKTTTARIIARAINYVGPDGKGTPTAGPTGDCPVATAIAEGRCPDVIEMDAASHTGVNDIRDLIDGVRYAPTMARYKVYIIDEVHMLSTAAFNALLKTLEEPPPHVKFIFATTEIRKVPMTILSRCQRFDLRRFDDAELKKHLADICGREKITAEDEALGLIARAGAGSARDGLSILDQAIALGDGTVNADTVRSMLGLVDGARVAGVLAQSLTGQIPAALAGLAELDALGADPGVTAEDMLTLTHQLIKARVTGHTDDLPTSYREQLLTQTLPTLSRAWQILLKSIQDISAAPDPRAALEMSVIRLGYASTLPDPGKLARTLSDQGANANQSSAYNNGNPAPARQPETVMHYTGAANTAPMSEPQVTIAPRAIHNLEDVVAVLEADGQMILATSVIHYAAPVKIEPGRIEIVPLEGAPPKLAGDLGAALSQLTGMRWVVSLARAGGGDTIAQANARMAAAARAQILQDPLVSAILLAFPGTQIDDNA